MSAAHQMHNSAQDQYVQFSTFVIAERLYGINVQSVQEVTRPLALTYVPLAPNFVKGLINLRGQISTAIDMRELFRLSSESPENKMSVVCRNEDTLVSLLIDQIGDVIEVPASSFEKMPDNVDPSLRKFIKGVHKLDQQLLTVIDVQRIFDEINGKDGEGRE